MDILKDLNRERHGLFMDIFKRPEEGKESNIKEKMLR